MLRTQRLWKLRSRLNKSSRKHLSTLLYGCEVWKVFKTGYVLPIIRADGDIDSHTAMPYNMFVRHLRDALVHIGMKESQAQHYAGHSMRAGGATSAAVHGLAPAEITHLAGVSSVDWLVWYNRHHLTSRLLASRAIGQDCSQMIDVWGLLSVGDQTPKSGVICLCIRFP